MIPLSIFHVACQCVHRPETLQAINAKKIPKHVSLFTSRRWGLDCYYIHHRKPLASDVPSC